MEQNTKSGIREFLFENRKRISQSLTWAFWIAFCMHFVYPKLSILIPAIFISELLFDNYILSLKYKFEKKKRSDLESDLLSLRFKDFNNVLGEKLLKNHIDMVDHVNKKSHESVGIPADKLHKFSESVEPYKKED